MIFVFVLFCCCLLSLSDKLQCDPMLITKETIMKKLVIFAKGDTNHRHQIRSTIEHSFDTFRKSLTSLMTSLDENIRYMNEYEITSKIDLKKIHDKFRKDVSLIPSLWEENEIFLRLLLSTDQIDIMYGITSTASSSQLPFQSNFKQVANDTSSSSTTTTTVTNKISSYDSLENILLHLHRDWSDDDCITTHISLLLNKVNEAMKDRKRNDIKVFVPGAALGRIAIELASLGYSVEMNECSPTMITAFNTIINKLLLSEDEYYYYPYLHATLNDAWDFSIRNQPKLFPPSNISHLKQWARARDGHNLMSLQYGDFVSNYKIHERRAYFDVIVTSFFIDTGNIIEYLDVLKYILKPGGIWINMGPLHYHSVSTIKYSYNQILQITSLLGFQLLNQSHIEGPYGCNKDINMKPDYYIVPLDVFQLIETEIENNNDIKNDDNNVDWKSATFSLI